MAREHQVIWEIRPVLTVLLLCSEVRECLKLDPDHKQCYGHYKQVKKLNKQILSAEELIQQQRCVCVCVSSSNCMSPFKNKMISPINARDCIRSTMTASLLQALQLSGLTNGRANPLLV